MQVVSESCFCFDVDSDTRFEFHGEVVGKDGNLLDELFDQSLIKLCDVGFLSGDEVLQFFKPCLNAVRRQRVSIYHCFCGDHYR